MQGADNKQAANQLERLIDDLKDPNKFSNISNEVKKNYINLIPAWSKVREGNIDIEHLRKVLESCTISSLPGRVDNNLMKVPGYSYRNFYRQPNGEIAVKRLIRIRSNCNENSKAATAIHELGHQYAYNEEIFYRPLKEYEAAFFDEIQEYLPKYSNVGIKLTLHDKETLKVICSIGSGIHEGRVLDEEAKIINEYGGYGEIEFNDHDEFDEWGEQIVSKTRRAYYRGLKFANLLNVATNGLEKDVHYRKRSIFELIDEVEKYYAMENGREESNSHDPDDFDYPMTVWKAFNMPIDRLIQILKGDIQKGQNFSQDQTEKDAQAALLDCYLFNKEFSLINKGQYSLGQYVNRIASIENALVHVTPEWNLQKAKLNLHFIERSLGKDCSDREKLLHYAILNEQQDAYRELLACFGESQEIPIEENVSFRLLPDISISGSEPAAIFNTDRFMGLIMADTSSQQNSTINSNMVALQNIFNIEQMYQAEEEFDDYTVTPDVKRYIKIQQSLDNALGISPEDKENLAFSLSYSLIEDCPNHVLVHGEAHDKNLFKLFKVDQKDQEITLEELKLGKVHKLCKTEERHNTKNIRKLPPYMHMSKAMSR